MATLGGGAEVSRGEHRSVRGLVLAARGILAQRDARVIESLPTIGVPTLVLWGEHDAAFVKPGEYMAAKIPGATRVVVPSAGHAANLDQPLAFFIPEYVPDPSVRAPGEELWVEVTLPKQGAPRPIRLGVKKDGVLTPLDLD